jgi:putative copper export protein
MNLNNRQSSTNLQGVIMLGLSISIISPKLDVIGILTLAWQWLIMIALTFWIGILVIENVVINSDGQYSALVARSRKQAQPLQWLCLSVLLVSEIIVFILWTAQLTQSLNGNAIDHATLGQILFQSSYSYIWIARVILILGSMALLWWTQNRPGPTRKQAQEVVKMQAYSTEREKLPSSKISSSFQPLGIVWFILAGFILFTYAISGDAAQLSTLLHFYAITLDWLTLAAQCIWFGGFAYLCYVLLPLLLMIEPDRRAGTLAALLLRFQPLMLAAICVLFVSEILLTTISLSNMQQFITAPYGRALLVYGALIFILCIMSAYELFVLRPKLIRQAASLPAVSAEVPTRQVHQAATDQTIGSLRQILSVQSWLGAAVLLCATLVTFYTPPIVIDGQQVKTSTSSSLLTTQTKQVDHLSVTLSVTPGKVNAANTVTVKITDTRSGQLVTNAHLVISTNMDQMDMGTVRVILAGGTPIYSAKFAQYKTFSMTGIWDITLSIQLPQHVQDTLLFQVWLSSS